MTTQAPITTTLANAAVQDLRSRMRGDLMQPGAPRYEPARRVYNGMIDRHPALITRCAAVADVISAVTLSHGGRRTMATTNNVAAHPPIASREEWLAAKADVRLVRKPCAATSRRATHDNCGPKGGNRHRGATLSLQSATDSRAMRWAVVSALPSAGV
jgi:hypothetical protein